VTDTLVLFLFLFLIYMLPDYLAVGPSQRQESGPWSRVCTGPP